MSDLCHPPSHIHPPMRAAVPPVAAYVVGMGDSARHECMSVCETYGPGTSLPTVATGHVPVGSLTWRDKSSLKARARGRTESKNTDDNEAPRRGHVGSTLTVSWSLYSGPTTRGRATPASTAGPAGRVVVAPVVSGPLPPCGCMRLSQSRAGGSVRRGQNEAGRTCSPSRFVRWVFRSIGRVP